MSLDDPAVVNYIISGIILMVQLYTSQQVANLKVYMHEKFVTKSDFKKG